MNYYIYIYLDPRKPGRYVYGDYCFLYEPFYVGKGKGKRIKKIYGRSKYFINKINKIKEYVLEPIYFKLMKNLSEEKSFILETNLIKLIGREDLNKGPLINFTNGGEGTSGRIISEDTKNKISKNHRDISKENNPNYEKYGKDNPFYGKHHSDKTKEIISEIRKEKYYGQNHPMFGKYHTEKSKKKMKENTEGEKHPNHKLIEQNVIEIRMDLKERKLTQKEIAEKFNIDPSTISDIKRRKTWSHINIRNHKLK